MISIGTLPDTATHNERRYAFFAGQVTLVSRRNQAKDTYDTDRYDVLRSGSEHVVLVKLGVCGGRVKFGEHWCYIASVSPDEPYSVWLRDGTRPAGCNCMAGKNNKPCKHIDIAKALLASDGPPSFGYVPQTETTTTDLPF